MFTNVLIVGAGPAAYTASIYTSRANLNPIQLLGNQAGGQLMITNDVENYPGFSRIEGPVLMGQMRAQAALFGTKMIESLGLSLKKEKNFFICTTSNEEIITAKSVIIATGAKAKWLGIESEEKFLGKGVSACATCDGFFFKNKRVVVIGGGNSAVEEALFLTNHASHVTLIHRREALRAEKILQDRLFSNQKITFITNSVVEEILGEHVVESVKIKNINTDELSVIETDGVFIAIGHKPETSWLNNFVETDNEGYIRINKGVTGTSVHGVFASGDVQDKVFRQAIVAAGQGCMAAIEVQKYLEEIS